jgi:hypothetical protein
VLLIDCTNVYILHLAVDEELLIDCTNNILHLAVDRPLLEACPGGENAYREPDGDLVGR